MPDGKYVLFALVKIRGFLEVIMVLPVHGTGVEPFNKLAVQKYLNNMSDKIQNRLGPLSGNIPFLVYRQYGTGGSNWSYDMAEEFKKRRDMTCNPICPSSYLRWAAWGMC